MPKMSIYFSTEKPALKIIIFIATTFISSNCLAWDGYDYDNDTGVEIGSGNFVEEGNIIQIYDWREGEYHDAEVKSIEDAFNSTRVEVYDMDKKEDRVLEMEKD
jgi:Family of unknown function (DUF5334)